MRKGDLRLHKQRFVINVVTVNHCTTKQRHKHSISLLLTTTAAATTKMSNRDTMGHGEADETLKHFGKMLD